MGSPASTTDTYYYDGLGNLAQMIDANGNRQILNAYDALDRKSTFTDALGHVTTWTYYPAGNAYAGLPYQTFAPGSSVGATSTTTHSSYDRMGRELSTLDPSGHSVGHIYDIYGRLLTLSDANGGYTYAYDALSRPASLTFPDATTQTWTYDPVGNQIQYKNRIGNRRTTQYDSRNRPIRSDWDDGSTPWVSWGFDNASRLTYLNNSCANIAYNYDDAGETMSETTTYPFNSFSNTTSYAYDIDGDLATIGYPAGDAVSYAYDGQDRCYGVWGYSNYTFLGEYMVDRYFANNVSSQFGYYADGRVNMVWGHHGSYDPSGSTFPGSNISVRRYGFAPDGQITWSDREADGGYSGSPLEDGRGESYKYNPDHSLSAVGWQYYNTYQNNNSQGDSNANPANFAGGGGTGGAGTYNDNFYYDGAGGRVGVNSEMGYNVGYATNSDPEDRLINPQYNNNGDITDIGTGWTYTYDAEDRMTSATRQSDGTLHVFMYDGAGRLIYLHGDTERLICYAGAQRIEEHSFSNNASVYRYYFDAPGSDRILLRMATGVSGPQSTLYYQYDAMGNTTHLSDANGTIVEQYLYDAYGTPSVYNASTSGYYGSTSQFDNRYLFHGSSAYQWLKYEGLYHCRARMYTPVHGRFLQPDPSGFAGGDVNLYRYCGNDPVNYADPSGLTLVGLSAGTQGNAIFHATEQTGIYAQIDGWDPTDWDLSVVTTVSTPESPGGANIGVNSSMPSVSMSATLSVVPHATNTDQLAGESHGMSAGGTVGEGEVAGGSLGYSNVPNGPLGSTDDSNYSVDIQGTYGVAMKSPISVGATGTNTMTNVTHIGSISQNIENAGNAVSNFFSNLRRSIDNLAIWSIVGGTKPPTGGIEQAIDSPSGAMFFDIGSAASVITTSSGQYSGMRVLGAGSRPMRGWSGTGLEYGE